METFCLVMLWYRTLNFAKRDYIPIARSVISKLQGPSTAQDHHSKSYLTGVDQHTIIQHEVSVGDKCEGEKNHRRWWKETTAGCPFLSKIITHYLDNSRSALWQPLTTDKAAQAQWGLSRLGWTLKKRTLKMLSFFSCQRRSSSWLAGSNRSILSHH